LAARGFAVVLAAREAARAETVRSEIAAATGNRDIDTLVGDFRSFAQVRQLSETFQQRYSRLDVLINNAGIFDAEPQLTEDGFDATLQVNYLSAFYLTHLMLGALKRSGQGRVINLSSSVHANGKFDPESLTGGKRYSTFTSYANSKLMLLLFTVELANRLKDTPVTANAVHPGIVRTPMMFNARGIFRVVAYLTLPFAISPERGAATSVHLASSPDLKNTSGRYFTKSREASIKTRFNTAEQRHLLWDLSMRALPRVDVEPRQAADALRNTR
jgi:NAD(P)-dependent dehydrogenase (short-subunit alcohol dehydrogenase family)